MNGLIDELIDTLLPALKSKRKARQLLEQRWSDRIAIIWTTDDVHRAANETGTVLNERDARAILRDLNEHHNPQYGLRWSDLAENIRQSGKGRDMRKQELNRFLHHDILVIDPESKRKNSR